MACCTIEYEPENIMTEYRIELNTLLKKGEVTVTIYLSMGGVVGI
jgi:hypothetical protein